MKFIPILGLPPRVDDYLLKECRKGYELVSDPYDCGSYYVCKANKFALCPNNLAFNQTLQYCDYPINVEGCEYYTKDEMPDGKFIV